MLDYMSASILRIDRRCDQFLNGWYIREYAHSPR